MKNALEEIGLWAEDSEEFLRIIRQNDIRPKYLHETPTFSMRRAEDEERVQPRVFRMDINLLPINDEIKEALRKVWINA